MDRPLREGIDARNENLKNLKVALPGPLQTHTVTGSSPPAMVGISYVRNVQ